MASPKKVSGFERFRVARSTELKAEQPELMSKDRLERFKDEWKKLEP